MPEVLLLGAFVSYLLIISQVALSLGITTDVLAPPSALAAPSGSFIDGFFTAVKWAYDAAGSLLQIMTFQAHINPYANLFLFMPILFMMLYLIIRLVRGGG